MKGKEQRKYWLDTMLLIGGPVLEALAKRQLKSSCLRSFIVTGAGLPIWKLLRDWPAGWPPGWSLKDLKEKKNSLEPVMPR